MKIPSVIKMDEAERQRTHQTVKQMTDRAVGEMRDMKKRDAHLQKAHERANKNRAPNNTAKLQDALYSIGAYKGMKDRRGNDLSYEKAVDGDFGRMTTQAVQRARNMGYDVNTNSGTVRRREQTDNQSKQTPWTAPLTAIGNLLLEVKPEWASTIHSAVPYVRQFTTYNTGGGTWDEQMLPEGGSDMLREIYEQKSGYTGGNNFSIRPGTPVYDKYTKKDENGEYIYPKQAAVIMSLQHQFGDVGMKQNPDNSIQVYDSYVWEPSDSKEREQYRIDVGGIAPSTARAEQFARKAAEAGFAPRSLAGIDDRTPKAKRNTTTDRDRNTEDIGTDSSGEYFKKGNDRWWQGVPTWNFTIKPK